MSVCKITVRSWAETYPPPPQPLCWRESALAWGEVVGGGLSVSGFGVLTFYTNQNGIVVCCPAE